jgi:hypothetical protein
MLEPLSIDVDQTLRKTPICGRGKPTGSLHAGTSARVPVGAAIRRRITSHRSTPIAVRPFFVHFGPLRGRCPGDRRRPEMAGKGTIIRKALEFLRRVRRRGGRAGTGARPQRPVRARPAGDFTPRPSYRDRHGVLTDGTYRVSGQANLRHTYGHAPPGRSHFNPDTDVDQLTLDAAQYADQANLWTLNDGKKAKIVFDQDIGFHDRSGQSTNVINVYRRSNGTIHGSPGSRL